MLRTLSIQQIPAARPRFSFLPLVSALISALAAVTEGLAASRQYQQSRSRGLDHDAAIREAFGLGPTQGRRVGPICFAGRA